MRRLALEKARVRTTYLTVAALTVLAFILTFHALGAKSLILDEAESVGHAREGLRGMWHIVSGGDPNGGLYYVLLDGWMRLFGDGEIAIRALTALVGSLTVPAIVLLGARLFHLTAGLVAGLLLALDGFFVQYAQTARAYALVILLVTLSSYFFVAELERPSRGNRVGYVLASSLAIYAHYFAGYVLLVQLLTLLALRRRAAITREWLGVAAAVVVLSAPAAVFATRKGTGWIRWISHPTLGDLFSLPAALGGHSRLLGSALVGLGAYALLRAAGKVDSWRTGFVAAWFVVPVLLAFGASFIQPMFIDYALIITLPALVLLAAAGLVRLPGRAAGRLVLVVLVALSSWKLSDWYQHGSDENYRAATGYILRTMRAGDVVAYVPPWTGDPIEYYKRRRGATGPASVGLPPSGAPPAHPRVWLVTRKLDVDEQKQDRLDARFASAYDRVRVEPRFRGVGVVLFRAARPGPSAG